MQQLEPLPHTLMAPDDESGVVCPKKLVSDVLSKFYSSPPS